MALLRRLAACSALFQPRRLNFNFNLFSRSFSQVSKVPLSLDDLRILIKTKAKLEEIRSDLLRCNEGIEAPQLTVIGADGNALGVMSRQDAILEAKKHDLDLVLVGAKAKPYPVARIISFKHIKEQEAKKKKDLPEELKKPKGMRFDEGISEFDLTHKIKKCKDFVMSSHPVNVTVRGKSKPESESKKEPESGKAKKKPLDAPEIMERICDEMKAISTFGEPKSVLNFVHLVFVPNFQAIRALKGATSTLSPKQQKRLKQESNLLSMLYSSTSSAEAPYDLQQAQQGFAQKLEQLRVIERELSKEEDEDGEGEEGEGEEGEEEEEGQSLGDMLSNRRAARKQAKLDRMERLTLKGQVQMLKQAELLKEELELENSTKKKAKLFKGDSKKMTKHMMQEKGDYQRERNQEDD